MSFKIKETVKWQEEMHAGKLDLFDRIFTINGSPGKNNELEFSVNFRKTKENNPEMKMALIEGANILNDPVCFMLEYESLDGSGQWSWRTGFSVKQFKTGLSVNPTLVSNPNQVGSFRKAHSMIQATSITYTLTFDLEVKNMVASPKANSMYEKLFLDEEFSDVRIICEGKTFHCHKNVLSCQSSVFKTMLNDSDMVEAKLGEIKINDIFSFTMENLLFFIYHDDLDENKISGELMLAADKYNISALYKFCVNYFDKNLTEENALDVMNSAYLKNETDLFQKACKFVLKHKLIGKEAWQDMKKDYVIDILAAMF